jgi:hypothetical protein
MADTTLAESSQALFCALADYVLSNGGKKTVSELFNTNVATYEVFSKMWNSLYKNKKTIKDIFNSHVDAGNTSFESVENYLKDNTDWYTSSILIARKVIEDIESVVGNFKGIKKPKASEIWFVRGDKPVMKNIEELFKIANKTQKALNDTPGSKKGTLFTDINKWSPADIYFASDKARNLIEEDVKNNSGKNSKGYSFMDLNTLISDLIEDGELLPLSLKKQTKSVSLHKVNFDRKYELTEIKKYGYFGINDWKTYTIKSPQARYLSINIDSSDKKKVLIFRHDPSTNAFKSEFVVSGGEARGGSVSSPDVFHSLFSIIDPQFGAKFYNDFKKSIKEFNEKIKSLGPKPTDAKLKKAYDEVREQYSALIVTNVLIPQIIDFLKKDKKRSDKFVHIMYQYVTSRSEESSKFIIAK